MQITTSSEMSWTEITKRELRDGRKVKRIAILLLVTLILNFSFSLLVLSYYRAIESKHPVRGRIGSVSVRNGPDQARLIEPDQTIHLASICGGHTSTRYFYTLLKSILFYRVNTRLEFHLFVDNVSRKILEELFRTWIVPDLHINYYHMPDYEKEVSWINNEHYSQRYGLLKLVVPEVLAEKGIKRVLFLDTDMLALGDISTLWNEFSKLDQKAGLFIGLVENLSDWYTGFWSDSFYRNERISNDFLQRPDDPWPASGRGFNTGVILFDLTKLKKNDWASMWREVAGNELISHLKTKLADQDIFNAIIYRHKRIAVRLDCRYNVQLNKYAKLDSVCPGLEKMRTELSLIHWNSPDKLDTENQHADYFRSWYKTFINWDAKLLERTSSLETNSVANVTQTILPTWKFNDLCRDIRPRSDERLRTFLYYLDFQVDEKDQDDDVDISIAVHLSFDRIWALDELASHWEGPISAALYLTEMDTELFMETVQSAKTLSNRKNIGYHLVFKDYGFNYPINRLRNIALNNIITPYVFLTDVDFLPADSLYMDLKTTIRMMRSDYFQNKNLGKTAFVVPAFENNEYKFNFPTNKSELIKQFDSGKVSKFRDTIWSKGQSGTNYDRWILETMPYEVEWEPEYEPFIVTTRDVPRFDERFNGFGWNKVEHIMQLAARRYKFLVLPGAFAIHQFHSASYDIRKHRESKGYQACVKGLKKEYLIELHSNYSDFARRFGTKLGSADF